MTTTCDHIAYRSRIEIRPKRFGEVIENNVTRLVSIRGGRRALTVSRCQCFYYTRHTLREEGSEDQVLDGTAEAITDALYSVTAQPDVDVFILDLYANRPLSVIVPRHHLPLLTVER